MANIVRLTPSVATVNIGTPVALSATPLLGGRGREGILSIVSAKPITSTVLIQGAPTDPVTRAVPASDDAAWATLATLTSASAAVQQINELPEWIRANTTVLDADGPDLELILEANP